MGTPPDHPDPKRCLVIDQGTHASRALIVDAAGHAGDPCVEGIELHRIDRRRVEQDPLEILASVEAVIRRAMDDLPVDCVALATQRSTVVAWADAGALTPAISWQDTRAHSYIERLEIQDIARVTGLMPSPHYAASKIHWLVDHLSEIQNDDRCGRHFIGPLASYLLWNLAPSSGRGAWVDHTNAARTLLFNLDTQDWDPSLLDIFKVPRKVLPDCHPTRSNFGHFEAAQAPITCVCGDQTAALYAGGLPRQDTAYVNIGTGAFVLVPIGSRPAVNEGLLCTLADSSVDHADYCVEATVNGAASAIAWAARKWQIPDPSPHLDNWLQNVDDPLIFINTIGGLGSPFWRQGPEPKLIRANGDEIDSPFDPNEAPAAMVAVVESILFLLRINLTRIHEAGYDLSRIQVSGGLANIDGLCQRLADLTDLPIDRPCHTEATAMGAAWLALGSPITWSPETTHTTFLPKPNPHLIDRCRRFLAAIDS